MNLKKLNLKRKKAQKSEKSKVMKIFNFFALLALLFFTASECIAYSYTLSTRAIMKSVYGPTMFRIYARDYGTLYCQLYGVASVYSPFKTEACELTARDVKEMRHFALTYTQNHIKNEEQYRLGYKDGWCFLQNGAHTFNAQIVRDGYAVVQHFDRDDPQFMAELETLEAIARRERRGLWNEWPKQMECLKKSLNDIAKDVFNKLDAQNAENAEQK